MATPLLTLGALFFASLVMCAAMLLGWISFGRPRHAASWGLAYGLSAVQSVVNLIDIAIGRPVPLVILSFVLVVLPGPLVVAGARQRACRPVRPWRLAAAALIESLFIAATVPVPGLKAIGLASATSFSAFCLLTALWAIRPQARAADAAERATMAAMGLLAALELATSLLTFLAVSWPASAGIAMLYVGLLAMALPPGVICVGVATVLLLASDLARELRHQAARDPLTGLLNRRGFEAAAARALGAAARARGRAVLTVADIDHFKAINDRHGHRAGDRTLRYVADRLSVGLRQGDIVARVGGEEFALLLLGRSAETAEATVEAIRAEIMNGHPALDLPLTVTTSFGVAEIRLDRDEPCGALLAQAEDQADTALYRSKTEGRNRVSIA
ncbi:GGDEF domain-containing protein [Sphingomonas morindae]|uniref:diguanylate cyclase n=1 Tax=Sphingomonas morindae TaxID=1541170 RepID=A0ABY4X5A3_9SPHN|nr:GGDEF domain-containing protein [Sphingomonas morindae]USI72103.1 GGDEF domain-containing protein [Sphingomonas morindae]